MKKAYATLACLALFTNHAIAYEVNTLNVYGISYHTGMSTEERSKFNELNTGLSYGRSLVDGNSRYMLDVGFFKNSYYDRATWVGGTYTYTVTSFIGGIDVGVNARHWRTEHNTYPNKPFQTYGVVSINPKSYMKINMLVRKSGPIFYLSFDY
jgi:hypothetical protein